MSKEVALDVTSALGEYSVSIPAGTYDIHLTPPAGGPFQPTTLFSREILADVTLNFQLIALPEPVVFSGRVVDRDNVGIPGQSVSLIGSSGSGFDQTDADGSFAVSVPPGDYDVNLHFFATSVGEELPNVPSSYLVSPLGGVSLSAAITQDFALQNRTLSGVVVDSSGAPVAEATVHTNIQASFDGLQGSAEGFETTGLDGNFS